MAQVRRQIVLLSILSLLATTVALAGNAREHARPGALRGAVDSASEILDHTLFLTLESAEVTETVVISGLTRAPRYRLDPESGTRFVQFSPPDAARIAAVLGDVGISPEQIFSILLDLELPVGADRISLRSEASPPVPDGGEGVSLRPVDPQLPVDGDRILLRPVDPQPLDPGCGECLNGNICYIGGEMKCCSNSSGAGCSACRTCGS